MTNLKLKRQSAESRFENPPMPPFNKGGIFLFLCLFASLLLSSCGSSGTSDPVGPSIDIAELESIRIDQIKFTGGIDNDHDLTPEVAVYVRCASNDQDMACSGSAQGLDIVQKSGVVYGRIGAHFRAVEGAPETNCADVQLVFVEKDSDNCPKPITSDDDIVWTSNDLNLDEEGTGNLLKTKIANDDGSVMAYLIGPNEESAAEIALPTGPLTENKLMLDQLYFNSPSIEGKDATFKIWVRDEPNNFRCETSIDKTSGVTLEDIIYGNLGIELLNKGNSCAVTDENKLTNVKVYFYVSVDDKTYITEESTTLLDLVDNDGGREEFGEEAFVRFYPVEGVE